MDEKIVKTVTWSDAKALLSALASKNLGRANNKRPADFCEFVVSYPTVTRRRMVEFLENVVLNNQLSDVTSMATTAEDSCLFSAEHATAIEVMLRHLNKLSTGGKLQSLWAFLDDDKKAIIHFINKGGWYAEAFFCSPEEFSVVHLMTSSRGEKFFIPVAFVRDLSKLAAKVSLTGNFCLQDYLPRTKFDFLSKGGKNGKSEKNGKNGKQHTEKKENPHRQFRDGWDGL